VHRDAWKACEGQSKEDAMRAYVKLVDDINPSWRG
jgi:acyl-CoA-binding protein